MAILTAATGLTGVFAFLTHFLGDGFSVRNLRITDVGFHFEFPQQTVYDDIQMQFAHAGDDGLPGFLIGIRTERRVLFCQFAQRNGHLFLSGFGLGLNGYLNNRFREFHGFQDDFIVFITQRIARGSIFQAYDGGNVAGIYLIDFFSVVCVHLHDTAYTFALSFGGVVNVAAGFQRTGVHTHIRQFPYKRVGYNLKGQCGKRAVIVRFAFQLDFRIIHIRTFGRRNIQRRRHEVYNRIQQGLYTLVAIARAATYRHQFACDGRLTNRRNDLIAGQIFAAQIFFQQLFGSFRRRLNQRHTIFFRLICHIFRNFFHRRMAFVIIVNRIVFHQVHNAYKVRFRTDRQLNRNRVCAQAILHHLHYIVKVCAQDIHLVHIRHARYAVGFRLAPYRFTLGFHAAFCAEHRHRAVQHAQRTFHFYRKVNVPGSVYDIDPFSLPKTGRCRGLNRNPAFLLLNHKVHGGCAFMHFANLMCFTCIEENAFRSGGLAGVNVRHNPDVPRIFKRILSSHAFSLLP